MCGIAGIFGYHWSRSQLESMVAIQRHRGPDGEGLYIDPSRLAGLGHNRLSIIDLSESGRQPMSDASGRFWIVFNGELYNYIELRQELRSDYAFQTKTDTEVLLAAYQKWGEGCLDRLIGMFAFAIWDEKEKTLVAVRDRFGVKPLHYSHQPDGTLLIGSEIKSLHAAGVKKQADETVWANYLVAGLYDDGERTFWEDIRSLAPGHLLKWREGKLETSCWYDLAQRIQPEYDTRPLEVVEEEYKALLVESVRLRFRSDVPVAINLSGGLDSSLLLGLVHATQGRDSDVKAFTFITGDSNYDELPWVRQMLAHTQHESVACELTPAEVPTLAKLVQKHQDEPFGGLPTLAYAQLFKRARAEGIIVLLDGQGLDEQWAGYDYYDAAHNGHQAAVVQGTQAQPFRPHCLIPEFRGLAKTRSWNRGFSDQLRKQQYRDIRYTKIPRALRFNDRVSMRSSTELREPFLDHRLFELALKQLPDRKIRNGTRKWFLRQIAGSFLPEQISEAPKRPLQTPQREWLRGPLRGWAEDYICKALEHYGEVWLDSEAVRREWHTYQSSIGDNSFYIWQWVNLGLWCENISSDQ